MTITVSAFVTSSGLTISSGDPLVVLNGGAVEFSTILSGGSATLSLGATAGYLTVSKGGELSGLGELTGVSFDAGSVSGALIGEGAFLELLSGGTASDVRLLGSGTILVDSGASASGTVVDGGALVDVLGAASGALIGGQEVVYSKGSAAGDTVESGGLLTLAGGTAGDEAVQSGGTFDFDGDLKSDFTAGTSQVVATTVLSGVTVSSGGYLNLISATVLSGATLSLAAGAVENTLTVSAGGALLGPGELIGDSFDFGSVGAVTIGDFGDLEIDAGGTASGVTVSSATIEIGAAASALGTVVESGGEESVGSGGVISGDTIQADASLTLAGGTASNVTVQSGGQFLFSENLATDFTQLGTNIVTATTVLSGVSVASGAELLLDGAAVLSGVTLILGTGVGGFFLTVSKGGELLGGGFVNGASYVAGSVGGVKVADGSLQILSGGTADDVKAVGGGTIEIDSGASATGTIVSNLGGLDVAGSAAQSMIESGGAEYINSGVASGDVASSGGALVLSGGTAIGETVQSGGTFDFDEDLKTDFTAASGPVTSTTVLSGVTVSSGGYLSFVDATVLSGATLSLAAGAIGYTLTVSKGAVLLGPGDLSDYGNTVAGSVIGASLESQSELTLLSGATADGVTATQSGGTVQVDSGASATGTVLAGGADLFDYGSTTSTVVSSGGQANVFGVDSGDIVSGGGKDVVRAGGTASGIQVLSDATLFVVASGVATRTTLSGGREEVTSGGVAEATTVLSGGLDYIYSGGQALGPTVSSGGFESISSGADAIGLTVLSGGLAVDDGEVRFAGPGTLDGTLEGSGAIVQTEAGDLVLGDAGTDFSGRAVIEGGAIELASAGALGTGYVQFVEPSTGSAVLQIDASDAPAAGGTFANVISNFSGAKEDIDLRSIAFVAGASATVVGSTLVLSDGGKTYTFNISGSVASAYPVLSDGHGGTLIDPKVVAFAQTAATFAPSHAAKTALPSDASPTAQMSQIWPAVEALLPRVLTMVTTAGLLAVPTWTSGGL